MDINNNYNNNTFKNSNYNNKRKNNNAIQNTAIIATPSLAGLGLGAAKYKCLDKKNQERFINSLKMKLNEANKRINVCESQIKEVQKILTYYESEIKKWQKILTNATATQGIARLEALETKTIEEIKADENKIKTWEKSKQTYINEKNLLEKIRNDLLEFIPMEKKFGEDKLKKLKFINPLAGLAIGGAVGGIVVLVKTLINKKRQKEPEQLNKLG